MRSKPLGQERLWKPPTAPVQELGSLPHPNHTGPSGLDEAPLNLSVRLPAG